MMSDLREILEWLHGRQTMGQTPRWFQATVLALFVLLLAGIVLTVSEVMIDQASVCDG